MQCIQCQLANDEDDRYCSQCGNYLRVRPGPAHGELLQLSPDEFLNTAAAGLPLIWENCSQLWAEVQEISKLGPRRAVEILTSFAAEEAAKAIIIVDALRCPINCKNEFRQLVGQIDKHIGKGIYVSYYDTSPCDMIEVRQIVDGSRRSFSCQGEFGQWAIPNSIKTTRESHLYVSYVRDDEGKHDWTSPRAPSQFYGTLGYVPGTIRVGEALAASGIFEYEALRVVRDYWGKIPFADIGDDRFGVEATNSIVWNQLIQLNYGMLQELQKRKLLSGKLTQEHSLVLQRKLLFPLYPFDLSLSDNFKELPEPEWPDSTW